jgi:ASC-1-like (ASCH) protein
MEKNELKAGDRIIYNEEHRGMVVKVGEHGRFCIDVRFDNGDRDHIQPGPWIILEALHDSPLMKALG